MTENAQTTASTLAPQSDVAAVGPVVGGGELLSMGLSMFVVVAAIVALGWLYSRSRWVTGATPDLINVVACRGLGPKDRLMVVEVGGKQLLVGVTASSMQTLHVLEEPIAIPENTGPASGFAAKLRTAFKESRS